MRKARPPYLTAAFAAIVAAAFLAVACGDDPAPAGARTPLATGDGGAAADACPEGSPCNAGSRFVVRVASFAPGEGAGFGQDRMPAVVMGPPRGAGLHQGSLDVVALGDGGEIVVELGVAAVDGPGPDLVVFENAFIAGPSDDLSKVFAEPGEVAVSDDGATFVAFPCVATAYPWGSCAGWHPVLSHPDNGISPLDPTASGGDPFDLADVGVARARFVRVRDAKRGAGLAPSAGFDLDAVAVVHPGAP